MSTPTTTGLTPVALADVEARFGGFAETTDVLVIGFGCAGAAAAQEAARAGASVLVLERASGPGGSSAQSGGELYLGGGTSIQQACGFEDDAENMYRYLVTALGPFADEEKIRLYADGSVEHFNWFVDQGLEFKPSFYDRPTWMPFSDDGLMWLGENAWPYNEVARAVPRGHRTTTPGFGGRTIMKALVQTCDDLGVRRVEDAKATALIMDGTTVVGAVVRKYGVESACRATRAVVLATGGFVDNEEMLREHAPELIGHGKVSDGLDDGSGIEMAQAIGAAVRRMSVVEAAYTAVPAILVRGLLVNARGQRFINEDVYAGLFSHAALHQPGPCWAIIDGEGFEQIDEADLMGTRVHHAAETLEELEAEIGMEPGSLVHAVARYNAQAEAGLDTDFHKDPSWLRVLEPPFLAVDPRKGFFEAAGQEVSPTGFSGFTLGGLATTVDGEVKHVDGSLVPGLYAVGRVASGMHGHGYISGTSLGDGTFFGRRAGRAAAAR